MDRVHAATLFRSLAGGQWGRDLAFWNPMERGWIKIWRCFKDNVFSNKPEYVALWFHMLLLATHKPKRIFIGGKTIDLKPGEFATSRKSLSAVSGVSEMKTERLLSRLEIEQQIAQQSFSKFRIITITNWDKYQNTEQQIAQQMHSKCTASEQQVNTIKKYKNERIQEEKIITHHPQADNGDRRGLIRKPANGRKASLEQWLKALPEDTRFWFIEEFWPEQIRKVSKKETVMAIHALDPDEALRAKIVTQYRKQCRDDYQHRDLDKVPHPSTWINNSRWEDEGKKKSRWDFSEDEQ